MHCVQDSLLRERFKEIIHRALFQRSRAKPSFGLMCRDEHHRHVAIIGVQPMLKLETIHSRHVYIQNQAVCLFEMAGGQEFFGRCEGPYREADGPKQAFQRLTNGAVVVVDGDEGRVIASY